MIAIIIVIVAAIIALLAAREITTWLSWTRRRRAERRRAMLLREQIWNGRGRSELRERRSKHRAYSRAVIRVGTNVETIEESR